MAMGVCLKAGNALFFGRKAEFIFEFIPQIVLLLCLFGFMDLMIIIKWLTDYSSMVGADPPSIITNMIGMCLSFGDVGGSTWLFPNQ
jgi:V-type H+-transporting ATPase subunit a